MSRSPRRLLRAHSYAGTWPAAWNLNAPNLPKSGANINRYFSPARKKKGFPATGSPSEMCTRSGNGRRERRPSAPSGEWRRHLGQYMPHWGRFLQGFCSADLLGRRYHSPAPARSIVPHATREVGHRPAQARGRRSTAALSWSRGHQEPETRRTTPTRWGFTPPYATAASSMESLPLATSSVAMTPMGRVGLSAAWPSDRPNTTGVGNCARRSLITSSTLSVVGKAG